MRPKATACLTAVFSAVLGGCGTVVNCTSVNGTASRAIYGGVRQDAANGTRHLTEAFSGPAPSLTAMPEPPSAAGDFVSKTFCVVSGIGMLAVDLPVSAIGDTLTLPVTVPATLMNKKPAPKKLLRGKPRSSSE